MERKKGKGALNIGVALMYIHMFMNMMRNEK
jgi:hypothetical protein